MSSSNIKVREQQYKNPTAYIGNVAFRGTSNVGSFKMELFLRVAAIEDGLERTFGGSVEDLCVCVICA
jgi:hypothetical protein